MNYIKQYRIQLYCIFGSILLFLLASRFAVPETDLKSGNILPRNGYGGRGTSYQITVDGLSEDPITLDIPVTPRVYREEEIPAVFDACAEALSAALPGDNASASEVVSPVNLLSTLPRYGVRVVWTSSDPSVLTPFGDVRNDSLTEAAEVVLTAHMTDAEGRHTADYAFPVTVLPLPMDDNARLLKEFQANLKEADLKQAAEGEFRLPEEFQGHSLSYSQPARTNYAVLLVLGPLLAVLLFLRDRQSAGKEAKARQMQMLLDYPEIISKLMVFIGAGMTVRLAWGCIVSDYETNGGTRRFAYEEMCAAQSKLKTGENEGQVYRDFGRACGLRQYMKLAGLLEQNRKTGLVGIRDLLGAEMGQAWEERKNTARRLGEEAGTKLLGPLFIMLLIVMVMIIVPAILSF